MLHSSLLLLNNSFALATHQQDRMLPTLPIILYQHQPLVIFQLVEAMFGQQSHHHNIMSLSVILVHLRRMGQAALGVQQVLLSILDFLREYQLPILSLKSQPSTHLIKLRTDPQVLALPPSLPRHFQYGLHLLQDHYLRLLSLERRIQI